ncbi:MAG: 5-(carboxyamino)imidazole ribonucleotide mutase [Bdellovibrionaceae bacterium]|nr:5-(carboxyamino)imidazole ribonucleotide mutase [Pseudobdellovibrionaceae bacterium]
MILVGIIMGSDSDLPAMKGAAETLEELGVKYKLEVVSAHRTPEKMYNYAKSAKKRGLKVIIAGAGGAAHLPGMVASSTILPVIGVPIQVGKLKGLDALLSIVQMPKGVPVATMAVDNSVNAGLLAARILAITDKKLQNKLEDYNKKQKLKVAKMNKNLTTAG